MHETVVAQSVFETIMEHANELGKKPVSAKMSCGQLNPINDEAVNFAFEAVASGTVWAARTRHDRSRSTA